MEDGRLLEFEGALCILLFAVTPEQETPFYISIKPHKLICVCRSEVFHEVMFCFVFFPTGNARGRICSVLCRTRSRMLAEKPRCVPSLFLAAAALHPRPDTQCTAPQRQLTTFSTVPHSARCHACVSWPFSRHGSYLTLRLRGL